MTENYFSFPRAKAKNGNLWQVWNKFPTNSRGLHLISRRARCGKSPERKFWLWINGWKVRARNNFSIVIKNSMKPGKLQQSHQSQLSLQAPRAAPVRSQFSFLPFEQRKEIFMQPGCVSYDVKLWFSKIKSKRIIERACRKSNSRILSFLLLPRLLPINSPA